MAATGGVEADPPKARRPSGFGFDQAQSGQFIDQAIDAPSRQRMVELIRGDPLAVASDKAVARLGMGQVNARHRRRIFGHRRQGRPPEREIVAAGQLADHGDGRRDHR